MEGEVVAYEPSEDFKKKVRERWAEGSEVIYNLAQSEAWRSGAHGQDYDDQMVTAKELGIMVGESRSLGVEVFLKRFSDWSKEQLGEDVEEDDDSED